MSNKETLFWFLAIIIAFALTLFAMGRLPICSCGYVALWNGEVMSAGNSQHIADWYTFSHIIHGFAFYGLIWLITKKWMGQKWPIGQMFLIAVLIEVGWEILENSPLIINYYRNNTVSLGYVGDSIINSVADVMWMSLGFLVASKLPVKYTILLLVIMELVALYFIRDNLFLNILMFIYPFDSIKHWQMAL